MVKNYRNHSKTMKNPKRPFEKERIDGELKTLGEYGLKNKREIWRVQYLLARIRKAARILLTLPENDTKRIFEGEALIKNIIHFFSSANSGYNCIGLPGSYSKFFAGG